MDKNLDAKALVKDPAIPVLVTISLGLVWALFAFANASVHFGDPR